MDGYHHYSGRDYNDAIYIGCSETEYGRFAPQTRPISFAICSLEQALHINGISNLHLFYMGPVVVPFYIGELLSNRFNVYIYKYEKGAYEFSGLMNHLDYMR